MNSHRGLLLSSSHFFFFNSVFTWRKKQLRLHAHYQKITDVFSEQVAELHELAKCCQPGSACQHTAHCPPQAMHCSLLPEYCTSTHWCGTGLWPVITTLEMVLFCGSLVSVQDECVLLGLLCDVNS